MRGLSFAFFAVGALALGLSSKSSLAQDKVEAGFTSIFNGKNLDGWKAKKDNSSLDGKSDAYNGRFKVADGKIVIDYKVKGDAYILTAKEFGKDVHVKLEFLAGEGCNNDLFLRGIKYDITLKAIANLKKGDWNLLEIIVTGDKAEIKCNGESQKKVAAKAGATPFMIRAEFGLIEFRNLRVKE